MAVDGSVPPGTAAAPGGERLVVAFVHGLHGLRGAVRIEPLSDVPGRFAVGQRLFREGEQDGLTVSWVRRGDPGLLVRFREVTTREEAESLRDVYLEAIVSRDLPEGAYYWHEVIGARVETRAGEQLGSVADVFRAGGGEVFAVRGGPRGEVLVPAVQAVVREFAPHEGRIVVDDEALGLEPIAPRRPRGRRSSKQTAAAPGPGSPGQPAEAPRDGSAG